MNKINTFIAFLLIANIGMAQNSTSAKITKVTENGLHKIILPTAVRSISKDDLSDFRIFDSQGNEVPYFYKNTSQALSTTEYVEYKIISEIIIPNKQTTIIFENPEKNISSLMLSVANYEGEKTYNLSGSNDQKQWYGLANNNVLYDLNNPEELSIVKIISFPKNNYKFLKIELNDKKSLPISILRIGNDNSRTTFAELLPVDYTNIKTEDFKVEKKTKIHVLFDSSQFLNQINFKINAPKLFKRTARIYKLETRKIKHKFETFEQEITNFELSSDANNEFNLLNIFEKDFYIEIENQDNQPLSISEIKFFQIPVSIIADLNPKENYIIKTGNPDAMAPVYDLVNFENSISEKLPEAKITEIVLPKLSTNIVHEKQFWEESWFMWICISVGGIAVLYFSISLLKDLNKNN